MCGSHGFLTCLLLVEHDPCRLLVIRNTYATNSPPLMLQCRLNAEGIESIEDEDSEGSSKRRTLALDMAIIRSFSDAVKDAHASSDSQGAMCQIDRLCWTLKINSHGQLPVASDILLCQAELASWNESGIPANSDTPSIPQHADPRLCRQPTPLPHMADSP